jgi:hypothetical protein
MMENRELRTIFGSGREEVTGGCRKLLYEMLHSLCSYSGVRIIIARRMRWRGHEALMRGMRNTNKILVGKPVGKRPRKKRRRGMENNTEKEIGVKM